AHRLPFWVNQRLGLLLLTLLLVALFGALRPAFLDERLVLFPLLRDIVTLTVVALAQMVVLSVGHMNLAVGRMAAFGAMFAGFGPGGRHGRPRVRGEFSNDHDYERTSRQIIRLIHNRPPPALSARADA
ncbi:hypothetical protein PUR61_37085, partial [Streptomyces sp. BE20]|nr:hypothetical protein [Streptomyces sp. BE20]